MKETEIIERAIEKFQSLTGIMVQYNASRYMRKPDTGILTIKTKPVISLEAEGKNEIRQLEVPHLLQKKKQTNGKFIIVGRYIPMPVKKILKSEKINYLETAGNCFIQDNDTFIYINDQKVTPERETGKSKLWNTAGLRFVFAVLHIPDLLNHPYRTIAEKAKIALGTVGKLIEALETEEFIKRGNRNGQKILFLERRVELINKWVTMYNTTLRPKQIKGRFKAPGNPVWQEMKLPQGIMWGGEMAGAKLTKFLKPEQFTLYTNLPTTDVLKQLKIIPDINGNIEVLNTFWDTEINNFDNFNEMQIVPPVVVYADLLTAHDSRNYETAERIKNKYFGRENKN